MNTRLIILCVLFLQFSFANLKAQEYTLRNIRPLSEKGFNAPKWSPDGKLIALTETPYNGLWTIHPDGSNLRQILYDEGVGYNFVWTPDSKEIAYLMRKDNQYEHEGRKYPGFFLKIVNLEKKESRTLHKAHRLRWPQISSDGDLIIKEDGKKEILIFNREGTMVKANKNKKTVYLYDYAAINVTDMEGNIIKSLLNDRVIYLKLSPDGTRICGTRMAGGNLIIIDIASGKINEFSRCGAPTWSPDGEYILYNISIDKDHYVASSELYVIKADGTGKTQLTFTEDEMETKPDWSPDGTQIVYHSMSSERVFIADIVKNN